eukprot:1147844-Pelagomonas_calceolata.AAC.9
MARWVDAHPEERSTRLQGRRAGLSTYSSIPTFTVKWPKKTGQHIKMAWGTHQKDLVGNHKHISYGS